MEKQTVSQKRPELTREQLSYMTGYDKDTITKVKRGERKDRRGVFTTIKEVKEFFEEMRRRNELSQAGIEELI